MTNFSVRNIPFRDGFLKVREWGSGLTVLLVHGWNANWSHFGKLIPVLLNQGYRVVAYDAPAHGESSGNQTNIVEMSSALLAVKKDIGEVHAVVGHSLGGATTALAIDISDVNTILLIATVSSGLTSPTFYTLGTNNATAQVIYSAEL